MRPFGVCMLVCGIDNKKPRLFLTEPSGIYSEWKAASIGRSSNTAKSFLEKNYKENLDQKAALRLTIESLLEVAQSSAENFEIVILNSENTYQV